MNEGTVGQGIGLSVAVDVVGGNPEDKTGNGILVEQGVGRLEALGVACPDVAGAVAGEGSVEISRALGQAREVGPDDSARMRSGNGHGVVPNVSVGGPVVVAPVELYGGVLAPDFHGTVERIARSLVGVSVGQGETVLGGQVAFQQLAVTVGQFTVVHHELGNLANGVLAIVVVGAELEPLRHEPIVVRTGGGLVVRAFLPCIVNDAGGIGGRVLALVLGDVQAPVGVADVVPVVDPPVEVETVGDATVVTENPVTAVGGDHAFALVAVHVSAVAGYTDGGVALGSPFAHFVAVAEVVAGPHAVALVLEVDYGPVVESGLGSTEDGSVVHVVHVATVARYVEPTGDRSAIGYALDGGSIEPDAQIGQGVGLPFAL